MSDLHNPHDQFIKILLSDPEAARIFIRRFLPAETSKLLDLSTLRLTDNSFVTDEMSSLYADLVFECELKAESGKKLLISILIEAKSTPYEFVSLQIGQYLLHGYGKQLSEKRVHCSLSFLSCITMEKRTGCLKTCQNCSPIMQNI